MKDGLKAFGSIILVLVFILGIAWIAQGNDFFLMKLFAPKYEQVRRETFEQSKAYNDGMCQELRNMQFEFAKATPTQKVALKNIILHRVSGFPEKNLPSDLQLFLNDLRKEY